MVIMLLLVLVADQSPCQLISRPECDAYTGMGAYSSGQGDLFSPAANPASLAGLRQGAAGIYGERRFLVEELTYYALSTAMRTSSGNFSLNGGYFGFSSYNETVLGLAYARPMGSKIAAGLRFNYYGWRIDGYGSVFAAGFDAGLLIHLSPRLHSGMSVSNPVGGKFGGRKDENLPSVYRLGWGFDASPLLHLSAEIVKEDRHAADLRAGLIYKPLPALVTRFGLSASAGSIWGGIGFLKKGIRIDLLAKTHPQLGWSPGIMLQFSPEGKRNEGE